MVFVWLVMLSKCIDHAIFSQTKRGEIAYGRPTHVWTVDFPKLYFEILHDVTLLLFLKNNTTIIPKLP